MSLLNVIYFILNWICCSSFYDDYFAKRRELQAITYFFLFLHVRDIGAHLLPHINKPIGKIIVIGEQ